MWTLEKERQQFERIWQFLWPAFGAVLGFTLGGLVGGALQGMAGAVLGALLGLFIGAEVGHVFGLLLLLIFRPWIEFFQSGRVGPIVAGVAATGAIATWALGAIHDAGLAVFVSCLGFALGDILVLPFQLVFGSRRTSDCEDGDATT